MDDAKTLIYLKNLSRNPEMELFVWKTKEIIKDRRAMLYYRKYIHYIYIIYIFKLQFLTHFADIILQV